MIAPTPSPVPAATPDGQTDAQGRDPWHVDWREGGSNALLSPTDSRGRPIATPQDRRWLWELETDLAVSATNDTLRGLGRRLRAYLNETCEHHWLAYEGDDDVPAHEQCMWCSSVEWLDASR